MKKTFHNQCSLKGLTKITKTDLQFASLVRVILFGNFEYIPGAAHFLSSRGNGHLGFDFLEKKRPRKLTDFLEKKNAPENQKVAIAGKSPKIFLGDTSSFMGVFPLSFVSFRRVRVLEILGAQTQIIGDYKPGSSDKKWGDMGPL